MKNYWGHWHRLCIALTLKSKMNSLQVKGIDVSEDALQIAKWNADHLGLEIELEKKDILKEGLNKSGIVF